MILRSLLSLAFALTLVSNGWLLSAPQEPSASEPTVEQSGDYKAAANEAAAVEPQAGDRATVVTEPASTAQDATPPTPGTDAVVETSTESPAADTPVVDEDAAAREARVQDLLSLVKDNTLHINKRENPAYFELLKSVMDQTDAELREAVTENPRFDDLYKKPGAYRGKLVHVSLNARRVLPVEIKLRNAANVTKLYELWGWTEEAKAHMYCCIVPELPADFPEQGDISKRVELTGYFFKLQAYQPGNAEPNARNLVAPLVLGRIVDLGPLQKAEENTMGNWPYLMIIGFGVIVMFRLMMHMRGLGRTRPTHRNYRRRPLDPIDPDALSDGVGQDQRGLRIRNANEV